MSEALSYYRSEHPVVKAYLAELKRGEEEFRQRVRTKFPDFPQIARGGNWFCWTVIGLYGKEAPGPLWHKKRGEQWWSPNGKDKAGRALWAELHALAWHVPSLPGFARIVWATPQHLMFHPVAEEVGGAFWSRFGTTYEIVEEKGFDPAIWQRAKASEYHLAKEAAESEAAHA